jgi:hypothetical protein
MILFLTYTDMIMLVCKSLAKFHSSFSHTFCPIQRVNKDENLCSPEPNPASLCITLDNSQPMINAIIILPSVNLNMAFFNTCQKSPVLKVLVISPHSPH